MRTTLTIDDDVLLTVRDRARREHRTVGDVLSELARNALLGTQQHPAPEPNRGAFQPLPKRGPVVSNALIDRLREDDTE